MKKEKPNYKIDKKTGHVLEVPTSKQVREKVKKAREKKTADAKTEEQPQQQKKVFNKKAFDKMQAVIDRMHAKAKLPDCLTMANRKYLSTVCVINKDGKKRELLPDKKGRHVMLCHGKMARIFTNDFCQIVKIQKSFSNDKTKRELWNDGSWAIVPCRVEVSNSTTIQEVRRRPWFFLRRYWYEITFDGHVQPAMMMVDYNLHPERKKQHFWVTREYVKVRNTDAENDYLRFWYNKPTAYGNE